MNLTFKTEYTKDAWGMGKEGLIVYAYKDNKVFANCAWDLSSFNGDLSKIFSAMVTGINGLMEYSNGKHFIGDKIDESLHE